MQVNLNELNLENALMEQYNTVIRLRDMTMDDEQVAPNQKAQVLNTAQALLAQITKSQVDLYNAERVKKLELALVATIKTLPKDAKQVYFTLYEQNLGLSITPQPG